MNIKKGDNVIITKGKDAGKKGTVVKVLVAANRVLVDGLNLKKRHMKSKERGGKGQTIDIPHSVARPNVALIDPKKGVATRHGSKEVNGKKVRVSKKSGQEV